MLKCAGSDDIITLSAQDNNDRITFVFESPSASLRASARESLHHSYHFPLELLSAMPFLVFG
jgi:hypothetical protein